MAVRELPPKNEKHYTFRKVFIVLDHTTVKLTMLTAILNALIDGEQ